MIGTINLVGPRCTGGVVYGARVTGVENDVVGVVSSVGMIKMEGALIIEGVSAGVSVEIVVGGKSAFELGLKTVDGARDKDGAQANVTEFRVEEERGTTVLAILSTVPAMGVGVGGMWVSRRIVSESGVGVGFEVDVNSLFSPSAFATRILGTLQLAG